MAVPIVVRDVIVGVVELAARPVRPFDTVDLELVNRFASSAAIALDGSAIYEEAARRVPSSSFAIPVGHAEHPREAKGRRKARVEDEYY
jgi:GAF domain-containing protein